MTESLSAADRSAITAERGPVNMTIGALVLLEDAPSLDYAAVCARIEERLHLVPRYRQRLLDAGRRRPGAVCSTAGWTTRTSR